MILILVFTLSSTNTNNATGKGVNTDDNSDLHATLFMTLLVGAAIVLVVKKCKRAD